MRSMHTGHLLLHIPYVNRVVAVALHLSKPAICLDCGKIGVIAKRASRIVHCGKGIFVLIIIVLVPCLVTCVSAFNLRYMSIYKQYFTQDSLCMMGAEIRNPQRRLVRQPTGVLYQRLKLRTSRAIERRPSASFFFFMTATTAAAPPPPSLPLPGPPSACLQ